MIGAPIAGPRPRLAEAELTRAELRILQAHMASVSPYADRVLPLLAPAGVLDRWARRLLPRPWADGWALFRQRRRADVVVTADYRTSLAFGALSRLFGRACAHIVKELYLDEAVLESSWRRRVFRWALRDCDCVVANCSTEVATYARFLGLPRQRVRFLPWPSNLAVDPAAHDDGSIFAAGRSFRDWATLFAAARSVAARFVVVAEAAAVAALERPPNVELHCDVPRDRYLELLRRARIVVVPLRPTVRSTGQAALLEALAVGKPVVAADTCGVADYVAAGETGLLYPAGDAAQLARLLSQLLEDAAGRRRLALAGARSIATTFNRPRYARRMLELADTVSQERRRAGGTPCTGC